MKTTINGTTVYGFIQENRFTVMFCDVTGINSGVSSPTDIDTKAMFSAAKSIALRAKDALRASSLLQIHQMKKRAGS